MVKLMKMVYQVYDERIVRTLEKDTTQSADEALVEIYKNYVQASLLL